MSTPTSRIAVMVRASIRSRFPFDLAVESYSTGLLDSRFTANKPAGEL
jgi:hypothetical protein